MACNLIREQESSVQCSKSLTDESGNIDFDVKSIPKKIQDKVFNCKSVHVYERWHDKFINFISNTQHSENFESVLLFFNDISKSYSPSTLWQAYSCLNKYYVTYKAWASFNNTPVLKNFIKKIEKDSVSKKQSLILSKEDLFKFIESAPDDAKTLVRKAVAIIGYYGGLRCAELTMLSFDDVAINIDSVTVFIRSSKTDPLGKNKFYFTIP